MGFGRASDSFYCFLHVGNFLLFKECMPPSFLLVLLVDMDSSEKDKEQSFILLEHKMGGKKRAAFVARKTLRFSNQNFL